MRPALNSILKLVSTTGAFLPFPHYEGGVLSSPKHLSAVCADGMELTIVNSNWKPLIFLGTVRGPVVGVDNEA